MESVELTPDFEFCLEHFSELCRLCLSSRSSGDEEINYVLAEKINYILDDNVSPVVLLMFKALCFYSLHF
jgi:hypothetical protein